mmetsp:Transcript_28258/g.40980  ORF Transcript_28258/g.40980 Transcript_28258/m.40980 type:complete len:436 (+) Transcript_28258:943-2250(+)
MFPIKCKEVLPVDHIVMNSISVRGRLGPLTVWVTKDPDVATATTAPAQLSGAAAAARTNCSSDAITSTIPSSGPSAYYRRQQHVRRSAAAGGGAGLRNGEIIMSKKNWTKIYEKTHRPSFRKYVELDLSSNPVILKPGQVRAIYIHSTLPGDEAIVYDNKQKEKTYDDGFITILPGRAHVSERPFGTVPIWGWGNPWRDNREFVGRISYGAVYKLWNPKKHLAFGDNFRCLAKTLFLCQRRWESPLCHLPDDCIFYILNMCRWDWVNDTVDNLRLRRKRNMQRLRQQQKQQQEEEERNAAAIAEEEDGNKCVAGGDMLESTSAGQEDMQIHEEEDDDWNGEDDDEDDDDEVYAEDSDDPEWMDDDEDSTEAAVFHYRDYDSDDSDAADEEQVLREEELRRSWLRRHFPRLHVLHSLVRLNESDAMEVFDTEESST